MSVGGVAAAWLLKQVAGAGGPWAKALVFGTEFERALARTTAAALRDAAEQTVGEAAGAAAVERLVSVLDEVWPTLQPADDHDDEVSLLKAMEAKVDAALRASRQELDLGDEFEPSSVLSALEEELGRRIEPAEFARRFLVAFVRRVQRAGSAGGPLTALASQLSADLTHAGLESLHTSLTDLRESHDRALEWAASRSLTPSAERVGPIRLGLVGVVAGFTGREAELASIEIALRQDQRAVVTQTLTGLGGAGKSQVAAEYVRRHGHEFDVVLWVRAELDPAAAFVGLGRRLGLPARDDAELAVTARLWLGETDRRCLLVLDNVPDQRTFREWVPVAGQCRVITTTRNRQLGTLGPIVEVDVFDRDVAASYLVNRTRQEDLHGARAVSVALGGLPLALGHAAAMCRTTPFGDYLDLLHNLPPVEMFDSDPSGAYEMTVASTWQPSLDAAEAQAAGAASMLRVASYLAPDAIPIEVLCPRQLNPRNRKNAFAALAALTDFSLLNVHQNLVDVHRLVQHVIRADDVDAWSAAGVDALRRLHAAMPEDPGDPTTWARREALLPHVDEATRHVAGREDLATAAIALLNRTDLWFIRSHRSGVAERAEATSQRSARELGASHVETLAARANQAAAYQLEGRTEAAIATGEQLVTDAERVLGAQARTTLVARGNLALAYQRDGQLSRSIAVTETLIEDYELSHGDEHLAILTLRSNLAAMYRQAGQLDAAVDAAEYVANGTKDLFGPTHMQSLIAQHILAGSYLDRGRNTDAASVAAATLEVAERHLGWDHPLVSTLLRTLAKAQKASGKLNEAIACYERAVTGRRSRRGRADPDTVEAMSELARAYYDAGRAHEAITTAEKVLIDAGGTTNGSLDLMAVRQLLAKSHLQAGNFSKAINITLDVVADSKRTVGSDHPTTLTALSSLVAAYHESGDSAEAIRLGEQVVADCDRCLGPEDETTLTTRHNLAIAYGAIGRLPEAVAIAEEVLAVKARIHGVDSPATLKERAALAHNYLRVGRPEEAAAMAEAVVAGFEQTAGPDDLRTLVARGNLAHFYQQLGRMSAVIEIEEKLLADTERILGSEHPYTLTAQANLAHSYGRIGKLAQSIALGQSVIAIRARVLGAEHPDTLCASSNLADSYAAAGQLQEGLAMAQHVVRVSRRALGVNHPDTKMAERSLSSIEARFAR